MKTGLVLVMYIDSIVWIAKGCYFAEILSAALLPYCLSHQNTALESRTFPIWLASAHGVRHLIQRTSAKQTPASRYDWPICKPSQRNRRKNRPGRTVWDKSPKP